MVDTQTNPQLITGITAYLNGVITALQPELMPLTAFSTRFLINEPAEKFWVPFLKAGNVAAYNRSSNNFGTTVTRQKKGVVVTLTEHEMAKDTVTPEDVAKYIPDHWARNAALDAAALAASVMGKVTNVVGSTSKITNTHELPLAMAPTAMTDLAKYCDSVGIQAALADVFLTSADYYDLLGSCDWSKLGITCLANGTLTNAPFGFKAIHKLPPSVTAGFVSLPQVLCIGNRAYRGALTGPRGDIIVDRTFTLPEIGLVATQTVVSDSDTKDVVRSIDIEFGAEIGDPEAGVKLTRAEA